MKWVKASDRLPEANKHVVLKQGNQFYGVYYSGKHKMIYSLLTHHYWPTTDLEAMKDLAWLDESIPASAVEEAKEWYPDLVNDELNKPYMVTPNEVSKYMREAHVDCAGMYTGEIEALRAENSKMRQALEDIQAKINALIEEDTKGRAIEVAIIMANNVKEILSIATETLKTT